MQNLDTKGFQQALVGAKSVTILLPENPAFDAVATALSLATSLEEAGKEVTTACPTPMLVEFNRLVGVNKVTDNIDNRNLTISFKEYDAQEIEKVSYNIENGHFMLVITPKPGTIAPKQDQIQVGYRGVQADLLLIIGADKKDALGKFAASNELFSNTVKRAIIGNTPASGFNPVIELINPQASSNSEVSFELIESIGLPINRDIATNLFMGVRSGTENFQKGINADTFAAASRLLRAGASIEPVPQSQTQTQPQPNTIPTTQTGQVVKEPENWQPKSFKGNTLP